VSAAHGASCRGLVWFEALTAQSGRVSGAPASLRSAEVQIGAELTRCIAVVPDAAGRFPRARHGEVGVEEAWSLAREVRRTMAATPATPRRALLAVVDVASQAYGRLEEMLGIHLACAAAADAYASARLAGHPVVALLVGRAMSGAFLAHGYQANRIVALDAPGVLVHAMSEEAAARVTRRTVGALRLLGERITPMAYDVRSFARLGLVDTLISGVNADAPQPHEVARVRSALAHAIADARAAPADLAHRHLSGQARLGRAASIEVRARMAAEWDAP
jgi:malonate decarboxylase gamma subunit